MLKLVLIALLTISIGLIIFRGESRDESPAPELLTGTIVKVENVPKAMTIETIDMKRITLEVDPKAHITVQGKRGSLADLRKGQVIKLKVDGSKVFAIDA